MKITSLNVLDLRFPTSRDKVGTDAVHVDPDYSAAYVILGTDAGVEGHGLTFTIGRGNEVCAAAIEAYRHLVVGRQLEDITNDFAAFWHSLAGDSQLRWLGPEKGVVHLALAAVVNAVWDLYAKAQRKPVWKLLADMTPAQLVSCVDFRHVTDAITAEEAVAMLEKQARTKGDREAELLRSGYPAYTTSVGWMGYTDEAIRGLCRTALSEGWTHFKVKVGGRPADDRRRVAAVRDAIGPDHKLMVDANQNWDVNVAIERIKELAPFNLWWAEEPTHPDDVLGHARCQARWPAASSSSSIICTSISRNRWRFGAPATCRRASLATALQSSRSPEGTTAFLAAPPGSSELTVHSSRSYPT